MRFLGLERFSLRLKGLFLCISGHVRRLDWILALAYLLEGPLGALPEKPLSFGCAAPQSVEKLIAPLQVRFKP